MKQQSKHESQIGDVGFNDQDIKAKSTMQDYAMCFLHIRKAQTRCVVKDILLLTNKKQ